jgi:hypothetical protein
MPVGSEFLGKEVGSQNHIRKGDKEDGKKGIEGFVFLCSHCDLDLSGLGHREIPGPAH